jgi:hypothetical protein
MIAQVLFDGCLRFRFSLSPQSNQNAILGNLPPRDAELNANNSRFVPMKISELNANLD